jgi:Tol biopolymer transport system component
LVDFGLASQAEWSKLTRSQSTLGTAGYMAPEQATGEGADHRSDLWSLGVILYEMLAGKLPFRGDHEAALMYSIVNEEPLPIQELVPEISPELTHVISRLLEKDPEDRYQSAAEVLSELKRLVHKSGRTTTVARPALRLFDLRRWKRKWVAILSTIVAVAAVATLAVLIFSRGSGPRLGSYKYTPFAPGDTIGVGKWSPDGKSIAYIKFSNHNQEIRVRALGSLRSTLLTSVEADWTSAETIAPIWSPDGSKLYYTNRSSLKSIGVAGGDPVTVFPHFLYAAGIAPDNTTLLVITVGKAIDPALSDSVGLFVVAKDGAAPRRFLNDPIRERRILHSVPPLIKFSPDGRKIALSYRGFEGQPGKKVWILPWPDSPDAKPRRIFANTNFTWPHYFDWLPDSRRIVLSNEDAVWLGDTEDETLERITASSQDEILRSVSPDGKRMLLDQMNLELDISELPFDGTPIRSVLSTQVDEYSASVSANGAIMAYVAERTGKPEVWIEEGTGLARPLVTPRDLGVRDSLFSIGVAMISPDGKRVAYNWGGLAEGRRFGLSVSNVEGGSPLSLLADSLKGVSYFCWSPDSKRLFAGMVFTSGAESNVIVPIGGGQLVRLPDSVGSAIYPAWSPDGRWIVVGQPQTPSHGRRLLLISPDGRQAKTLDAPGSPYPWYYAIVWSKDSKTLYVAKSTSDKGPALHAIDVRNGATRTIATYGGLMHFGPPRPGCCVASLSRDGKGILVTCMYPQVRTFILDGAL